MNNTASKVNFEFVYFSYGENRYEIIKNDIGLSIRTEDFAKIIGISKDTMRNRISTKNLGREKFGWYKRLGVHGGRPNYLLYLDKGDDIIDVLFSANEPNIKDEYKLRILFFIDAYNKFLKDGTIITELPSKTPKLKLVKKRKIEVIETMGPPVDILTQTENNFQKMGQTLVDMFDIFSTMLDEVKQLRQENLNVANAIKQKIETIQNIELRLRRSNEMAQQWFIKYEDMKKQYYEK